MNVLGIIPARGGSKGIKRKNIRNLANKPLIEYTISEAKKSNLINKLILSTDDKIIANFARKKGVEVPFLRPKKISGSNTNALEVIKHATKFLATQQSYYPDIIVYLQPTSPLRTEKTIDKSINLLKRTKASSIVSVIPVKHHPYISFWHEKGYLKPFTKDIESHGIRQKRKPLYAPSGSVFTFWYDTLKKHDSLYGPKIKPLIEEELNQDIDTIFEFFICEMIIKNWKKFKKDFR